MERLRTLVIGAGDRGNAWALHKETGRANMSIVAVAEPDNEKREEYADKNDISKNARYREGKSALSEGKPYDAVIIATPDKTHRDLAVQALNQNYNVLLEKPMATIEQDCRDIVEAQKESGKVLSVAHVLRYAPFFEQIKEIVDSKELGKITGIDLTEEVGYWHFAHSYVRGNWRKESDSSPIILSKSCHDLDIMAWFADSRVRNAHSKGYLGFFTSENAPENSLERCTDGCLEDCLFDARKFYLGEHTTDSQGNVPWPYSTISTDTSEKARLKAIQEGPYGKCIFKCDNDVCDSQDVLIEFENKVKANFRLRRGGDDSTRHIKLYFTRGELFGDLRKGKIHTTKYTGLRKQGNKSEINLSDLGGHGGGDARLIKNFADMIRKGDSDSNRTSAELSLQSHLIAFAAEKSRKTGKIINF